MISKLYVLACVFSLATMLAGGGFAGYLFVTGRLSSAQLDRLAALLHSDPTQDPKSEIHNQPPTATQPAESAGAAIQTPNAKLHTPEEALRRDQLQRVLLDRAAADVAARQTLVNQTVQHLLTIQEDFDKSKRDWQQQRDKLAAKGRDAGFEKELEYVSKLSPKLAKEHIVRAWAKEKSDVVRLFVAMDRSAGQKIMEQLKSPTELQLMHELLEQLRLQNPENFAAVSRKKSGD